jgi:hypothetical protein
MNKLTLFETPYADARQLDKEMPRAVEYLTKYGQLMIVDHSFLNDIKIFSTTAASTIFTDIKDANKGSSFLFYNIGRTTDVPTVLTVNDLTVDGAYIPKVSVPDKLKKCWVNLTPIISQKDSYNGRINVTDVTELSHLIMRGALTMSYHSSDTMWLPPNLAVYVIEFYSGVITNTVGQVYNLNYDERLYVQTLFAAYYAQCLGGSNSPLDLPPLLMRCQFLGSGTDIQSRMMSIKDSREDNGKDWLYPAKVCDLISKHGPPRMKKFSAVQLYRYISATAIDSQVMLLAIDFPPYWVFQMLKVAYGYKNPVMNNMLRLSGTKTKLQEFAKNICDSGIIVKKVQR